MSLKIFIESGVRVIVFNEPKRKNPISIGTLEEIKEILNEDAKNDKVVVTIITGAGNYFSCGIDLKEAVNREDISSFNDYYKRSFKAYKDLITAFIEFPKILIAFVNGPCVGIGFAICTLCDVIVASNNAKFRVPNIPMGFSIEGLCSYLLPRIIGRSKASEILFLGNEFNAEEALKSGFITKIIRIEEKEIFLKNTSEVIKSLNLQTLIANKELIMRNIREALLGCHERECEQILKLRNSESFFYNFYEYATKYYNKL